MKRITKETIFKKVYNDYMYWNNQIEHDEENKDVREVEDNNVNDITNNENYDDNVENDNEMEEENNTVNGMEYPDCCYKGGIDANNEFSNTLNGSETIATVTLYSKDEEHLPFVDWCIEKGIRNKKSKGVAVLRRRIANTAAIINKIDEENEGLRRQIAEIQRAIEENERKNRML